MHTSETSELDYASKFQTGNNLVGGPQESSLFRVFRAFLPRKQLRIFASILLVRNEKGSQLIGLQAFAVLVSCPSRAIDTHPTDFHLSPSRLLALLTNFSASMHPG